MAAIELRLTSEARDDGLQIFGGGVRVGRIYRNNVTIAVTFYNYACA